MSTSLINIAGIDNRMEKILASRANIKSFKSFRDKTRTPEERAVLAEKTKLPLTTITYWAAQAELLRIATMSSDLAIEFIEAGFYSVYEIQIFSVSTILEKIKEANSRTKITEEVVRDLQNARVDSAREFVCTKADLKSETVQTATTPNTSLDLSCLMMELKEIRKELWDIKGMIEKLSS